MTYSLIDVSHLLYLADADYLYDKSSFYWSRFLMKKILNTAVMSAFIAILSINIAYSDSELVIPIAEFEFVKIFSGKDSDFVREKLGEPEEIMKRENESGTVEFWIYKNIVKVGNTDKTYKYTQIGIINNYIETLGNTNRSPK